MDLFIFLHVSTMIIFKDESIKGPKWSWDHLEAWIIGCENFGGPPKSWASEEKSSSRNVLTFYKPEKEK